MTKDEWWLVTKQIHRIKHHTQSGYKLYTFYLNKEDATPKVIYKGTKQYNWLFQMDLQHTLPKEWVKDLTRD